MRQGEKCVFTLDATYFGGKLKPRHRYKGSYAGVYQDDDWVVYHGAKLRAKTVEPIKKTVVKKEKAPTASDYKKFADVAFEVGVRFRDGWCSVISGQKFEEGDWNGLQAGHGVSRQHWATRHNPLNCHAITSGQNFHMSLGTTKTIAQYWAYVAKKYGQNVVDDLLNNEKPSPKLTISYLKEDCKKQYDFLHNTLMEYLKNNKIYPGMQEFMTVDECIVWRCERLPKKQADGVLKVLKLIQEGQI